MRLLRGLGTRLRLLKRKKREDVQQILVTSMVWLLFDTSTHAHIGFLGFTLI